MQVGNGTTPQEAHRPDSRRPREAILRTIGLVLAAGAAFVVGLIGGSGFGGNYAPDFLFLGMPGYEGSGLLGGVTAGAAVLVLGGLASTLLKRRSTLAWVLVGALASTAIGPRLLFPVIPPDELAFALTYVGCAAVGAVVGLAVGRLRQGQVAGRNA